MKIITQKYDFNFFYIYIFKSFFTSAALLNKYTTCASASTHNTLNF